MAPTPTIKPNRAMRRRTFTVGRPTDEPPQFDLAYEVEIVEQPAPTDEVPEPEPVSRWEQRTSAFRCVRRAPGGLVMQFLAVAEDDAGMGLAVINQFMEGVIDPADLKEWRRIIASPEVQVPIETLAEIATWLVGLYTERPTEPPQASSPGRSSGGTGATEQPSSEE